AGNFPSNYDVQSSAIADFQLFLSEPTIVRFTITTAFASDQSRIQKDAYIRMLSLPAGSSQLPLTYVGSFSSAIGTSFSGETLLEAGYYFFGVVCQNNGNLRTSSQPRAFNASSEVQFRAEIIPVPGCAAFGIGGMALVLRRRRR